jgi:hypothetical protein
MLLKHCLWHVKGVAAKYFSALHAPAKRIFRVKYIRLSVCGGRLIEN